MFVWKEDMLVQLILIDKKFWVAVTNIPCIPKSELNGVLKNSQRMIKSGNQKGILWFKREKYTYLYVKCKDILLISHYKRAQLMWNVLQVIDGMHFKCSIRELKMC